MRKAIKLGILIYLIIQLGYLFGAFKEVKDDHLIIQEEVKYVPDTRGDTARHYKQNFQKRSNNKEVDINQ
jgi:hypothetical protein